MKWYIALVGLFWIVVGLMLLVATKKTMLALTNLIKNARRQTLGLFSLIFGVLLLLSASSTQEAWFVSALGIIACLKGASIVLMSEQKLNTVLNWWMEAPDVVQKGYGTLILILGIVMFYII